MILTDLNGFERYVSLNPGFAKLLDYIRSHDLLDAALGRIELDGDRLFINNISPNPSSADGQPLEMHRAYIDVHMLLSGRETIGWKDSGKVEHIVQEYDAQTDCALSDDKPSCYVNLCPGDIVVCFPEDAHAPAIGEGEIRKIIAKVRI